MSLESRYSRLDRLLHKLAFSTIEIQKVLADFETRLYSARLEGMDVAGPVFITSLPRSGTTLLLDLVGSADGFGTNTYRDMPFILIPVLWAQVSPRQRDETEVERAHGDGMTIGVDSREAFEEVLWRAFWPDKYLADRITPWDAEDGGRQDEFDGFFLSHIRKVLYLRGASRYVSKNNVNISRSRKLASMFPDAVVLVPFRNPADHAVSLWRQHMAFVSIHQSEPFTKRYMADLGHFDFGLNLRPMNFNGWLDVENVNSPDTTDFWLRYWCVTFEAVLNDPTGQIVLLDYDRLCNDPVYGLERLGDLLGTDLSREAGRLRRPNSYGPGPDANADLTLRAALLWQELKIRAVNARC